MIVAAAALVLALTACGQERQESELVISSDPELGSRVAELLPELASRAHMELVAPVRVERRSREELVSYLEFKLDEELPREEANHRTRSYELLGLVPADLDLRAILLSVYTEQVAGFYDPDSTALFVMDDMAVELLEPVLVHELVHAVQDQTANLDSLTAEERGNDRIAAAQSAIEGHATLVMLEYMTEQMRGEPLDFSQLPDFSEAIKPALEGMRTQYPALASAPTIVQEGLLFPYLEGVGYVGELWRTLGERPAPFGGFLPQSTEQVLNPGKAWGEGLDPPTEVEVTLGEEGVALFDSSLGQMELEVLLTEHLGEAGRSLANGWDGDHYLLVRGPEGGTGLVWASVWDSPAARDRFAEGFSPALEGLPAPATLESVELEGRPGVLLRIGVRESVDVSVSLSGEREG